MQDTLPEPIVNISLISLKGECRKFREAFGTKTILCQWYKNIHHFRKILCPAVLPHLGHFFDLESILLLSHNYKKQGYMITLFFIHSVLKIY
jgi:hypothetical protein